MPIRAEFRHLYGRQWLTVTRPRILERPGQKVIVMGNEAFGRYVEHLDLHSGKTLANKQLDADPKSLLGQ